MTFVHTSGTKTFNFPRICPCCGDAADSALSVIGTMSSSFGNTRLTRSVEVPYCSDCTRHLPEPWIYVTMVLASGLIPAVLMWAVAGSVAGGVVGRVLAVLGLLLLVLGGIAGHVVYNRRKTRLKKKSCVLRTPAVQMRIDYANTTFCFASDSYARTFRQANTAILRPDL